MEKRRQFLINTAYIAVVAALAVLALRYAVPWLLPFLLGFGIAMACKPLVRLLMARTPLGPRFCGCVVVLLFYAVLALLLFWGGTRVVALVRGVAGQLPDFYSHTLRPALLAAEQLLSGLPGQEEGVAFAFSPDAVQGWLGSLSAAALGWAGTVGGKLPGFALGFLFTILSSLTISMNYDEVAGFLARQLPERLRPLGGQVRSNLLHTVGNYLIAYGKLLAITFCELTVGLMLLRVRLAPLVAFGIALFDIVPVLGAGGILLPWAVISLLGGRAAMAAGLAILYVIILTVRAFLEPRIIGGQLGLHPLVTLFAIYLGFRLMGVGGMILFPISAQILVGLQRSGIIKLWKT